MGWYLDGRVSAVVGTHTHVPTADARVLPGARLHQRHRHDRAARLDHRLSLETVLPRFTRHLPTRFQVAEGPVSFNAVVISADRATGGHRHRAGAAPRRGVDRGGVYTV